jgi:hypothetical protein
MLAKGQTVEMISGAFHIYCDVSRWGACLNVSFDEIREKQDLADYLAPMKALEAALARRPRALAGVRLCCRAISRRWTTAAPSIRRWRTKLRISWAPCAWRRDTFF